MTTIAQEPIKLPGSPFWNAFKSFGRDEFIALIINVIGTVIAAFFVSNKLYLAIIGPIIEKVGFFPAHIKEARDTYHATPGNRRLPFKHYLKIAFKNGSVSLAKDLAIHDTCYIALMYGGLTLYPQTPVWLLALSSFLIAVMIVAFLEVAYTEINYLIFKNRLKRLGFAMEAYYECRFYLDHSIDPKKVLDSIAQAFSLKDRPSRGSEPLGYDDFYRQTVLPIFSGRIPQTRLRFRDRTNADGKWSFLHTVQVVYTRTSEALQSTLSQFRFFVTRKEKFYFILDPNLRIRDFNLDQLPDGQLKNFLKQSTVDIGAQNIRFSRALARNEHLLVSIDAVLDYDCDDCTSDFCVLELKTHRNLALLVEAMRFVMHEFPVVQTTNRKIDFCS